MLFSIINLESGQIHPKTIEYSYINSESDQTKWEINQKMFEYYQTKWEINQKMFEYFIILILIIILSIILLNFRLLKL
jgi:hypothetical protein